MPRKSNNRPMRPDSLVSRTAQAVKSFLWNVLIGLAITGAVDEIFALIKWFLERRV
jgi:hypothetical protein